MTVSYSKDALFLGELSCAERPEVDVGFAAGDDVGAFAWVKLHSEHSFVGILETQHTQTLVQHGYRFRSSGKKIPVFLGGTWGLNFL